MDTANLTNENKVFIRTIFNEMRKNVQNFIDDRDFVLSNPQLFTFLSNVPAALAIASDGTVDENEIAILEKIAKTINIKATVSLELTEMMAIAFEPENIMTNEEFNIRIGSELLYLSRNIEKYEKTMLDALKALLTFDFNPKADGSLTSSFAALMDNMIAKNRSKNKEDELKKMNEIKSYLGMA